MASIFTLLLAVFASISEVVLLCYAGYLFTTLGIVSKGTQKELNRLNVLLFTPAFIFSKVAFFLTPAKLLELWVIPALFLIVTLVSTFFALTLGSMLSLKRSQKKFAIAGATIMNTNSLPVALMQSLVPTTSGLNWKEDDTKSTMIARALSYIMLYGVFIMILRYSYVVKLLEDANDDGAAVIQERAGEHSPLLGSETVNGYNSVPSVTTATDSLASSPNASRLYLPGPSDQSTLDASTVYPVGSNADCHSKPSAPSTMERAMKVLRRINRFMTVPTWASLAAILVGCIPPLQYSLETYLFPVKSAVDVVGNCCVPVTLMTLGAYFYVPEQVVPEPMGQPMSSSSFMGSVRKAFRKDSVSTAGVRRGETKTVVVVILSRMVLTPLVLIPSLALIAKYDLHPIFQDPIFMISSIILVSSPSAINLAQAICDEGLERLITRTIFWAYCVTPPAAIICIMIGLLLVK